MQRKREKLCLNPPAGGLKKEEPTCAEAFLKKRKPKSSSDAAEARGFEPLRACALVVFKTTALVHYATPPRPNGLYLSSFE